MFENVALIIIANFALYLKTLKFKFVSDDFSVFHNPPVFKNAWHKRWLQFTGACKLKGTTYSFVWHKGKLILGITKTEEFEHLLALLIHAAICVLIYTGLGANQVSFVAALLYSVNPVNNQGTIWPGCRGYALPILSLLLSMAVPILSPILLYFCSWYTIGFLAPLTLIGSHRWYLLGLMPIIWWLHSRKFVTAISSKAKLESFDEDRNYGPWKIIIFLKTYGFYLILCLI